MTSLNVQKIGENKTSFIEVEKAKGVYLNSNYIETGDKKQLIQSIPPCYVAVDGSLSDSAPCPKNADGDTFSNGNHCIHDGKIYVSGSGDCKEPSSISSSIDYVLKCTATDTCVKLDDVSTATSSDELLIYHCEYNEGCTWTQKKDYYYYSTKFIYCTGEGNCSLVTNVGYYINPGSDASDNPVLGVASGGSVTPIAKVGYYIDASDNTKIISCVNDNNVVKCSSISNEAAANAPTHFLDAISKRVITCVASVGCTLEDASIKGYFINSDTNNQNTLLKCNGTKCEVVSASNKKAGGYTITTGASAAIHLCLTDKCTTDSSERVKIEIGATAESYHAITVAQNVFPGVSKASTISVKVDIDGSAFLLEAASLPTCSSTDSGSACKANGIEVANCISSNKIYTTTTNTCGTVTSTTETKIFYFNSKNENVADPTANGVATSLSYMCTFTESEFILESCKIVNGYTLYNSSYIKCSGWKKDVCTVVDSTITACTVQKDGTLITTGPSLCFEGKNDRVTMPSSASEISYIAYNTTDISTSYGKNKNEIVFLAITKGSTAVESIIVVPNKKGYFVNLSVSGTTKDALIKCTDNNNIARCVREDAKIGYYLHGDDTNKLIKCESTGCTVISITSSEIGYYIDATNKAKLINCVDSPVACTSSPHKGTKKAQVHYVGASGIVITCNQDGCFDEDASIKGYFLNSGSTTKHVISCDGTGCSESTDNTSCGKAGDIKVDGSTISLCITANDESPIKLESLESGEPIFKTLSGAAAGDITIPGASTLTTADIKIGKDGSVILLEDMTLPDCPATIPSATECISGDQNKYCISKDSTTSIITIYKTVIDGTDKSCEKIEGTKSSTSVIYFNSNSEPIDGPAAGKSLPNIMAYQCTFGSDTKVTSCKFVKGYAIDSTNSVQCSGWKREGCSVTIKSALSSCTNGNEGNLGSSGLCFGNTSITLPTSTSVINKVAFQPTKFSSIYGISNSTPSFLIISSNSVLVAPDNDEEISVGYFKNANAEGTKENALIYCSTAKTLSSCESKNALNGYYLNAASNNSQNQIIKCSTNGCIIDKVTATSCGKSGTLIKDKDTSTTIKLCKVDSAKDDDIIQIPPSDPKYETLTVKANNFPGVTSDSKIAIKIGNDGNVVLLEEYSLPYCDKTSGSYCINDHPEQSCYSSGKIYMVDGNSKCNPVTSSDEKEIFYFNSNYENVDISAAAADVTTANMAYQCTFEGDNNTLKSCELVKGYVKGTNNVVYCSGWKGETCNAPATASCAADMNGEMESTNKKSICFNTSNSIDITALTNEEKIAFELTKTSNIYGEKEGDMVVLSLSTTEALVTTLDRETTRYFINQNSAEDKEIIKCDSNGCISEPKKIGYYLEGGSETEAETKTYSKLIKCDATSCTVNSSPVVGYYVDASTAKEEKEVDEDDNEVIVNSYEKLILCESDDDSVVQCRSIGDVQVGYYLNATPNQTNKFTDALIKCSGTDKFMCKLYKVENENSIYINIADKTLIQCIDDTTDGCQSVDTDALSVLYGSEDVPFYYVNADDSVTNDTRIIKCVGVSQCELIPASANDIFLNGNLKTDDNDKGEVNIPLILCDEEGCISGISGPKSSGTEYYINSGINKGDNEVVNPIIKCVNDGSSVTCEAAEASSESEIFFINGNYENDKKYLLKCKNSSCEIYGEANSEGIENYIHGAATDLSDAIIECTLAEDDDNEGEFLATCKFPETAPEAGNIYINSFNKNLIQCSDAECSDFNKVIGTNEVPVYFVNGDKSTEDEEYKGLLIKCTGVGTCASEDSAENNVYINSNFKDETLNANGDDTNRLIICSGNKCTPTNNSSIDEGKNVYYVNGGIVVSESDPYKYAMIQCGSSNACSLVDGGEDYIYVNSNSLDTENSLIYCNSGKCEPISGAPEGDESEYYINTGTISTDKLIECNSDGCEVIDLSEIITENVTEFLVKNKNYGEDNDPVNYLIKCTADNCVPYGTENPTAGSVEYYVNNAQSDLSDAVIKVEFSSGASRKRSPVVSATISYVENINENDIFINSSTKKLIQCSSDKCEAFESTGTSKIPAYYVNAAATTNEEYKDYIIKCIDVKCSIENGHQNDVYLNANLKDTEKPGSDIKNTVSTDEENQLIICTDGECKPEKIEVEDNDEKFFINSGEYNDGTNDYALIKCTSGDSTTCQSEKVTLESGVSEVFYVNGNYDTDKDSVNYLISCVSSNECSPIRNRHAVVGTEYYVHGASDELSKAIIECSMTSGASRRSGDGVDGEDIEAEEEEEETSNLTASCSIIETAKPGNVYIDASKPIQVIKCKEGGCKAEATSPTDKISQFYLNEKEDESKELIKCVVTLGCTIYDDEGLSEGNHVFLNSNYGTLTDATHQLIKCSADSCELSESQADTGKPEYYVNDDGSNVEPFKDDIIKCEKVTEGVSCGLLTSGNNKVYLNADFSTTNVKQLIICSSEGCSEEKVEDASSESLKYYVNAGHVNSELLKDTLIICADSTTACETIEARDHEIYIDNSNHQLILCTTSDGCIGKESGASPTKNEYYLNSSDLNSDSDEVLVDDLIKCSVIESEENGTEKVCTPEKGNENGIYINAFDTKQLIYCVNSGCNVKDVKPKANEPLFFVNGDNVEFKPDESGVTKDTQPNHNDLIKCKKNGESVSCDIINGEIGKVYINGNYSNEKDEEGNDLGDTTNQLIICTEEGCTLQSSTVADEKLPEYYINSGNDFPNKLTHGIIKCVSGEDGITCAPQNATEYQTYYNANVVRQATLPLIKCSKSSCVASESKATLDNNEYYINSGDSDESSLTYDIIRCQKKSETEDTECEIVPKADIGVYLNSNYSPNGDSYQLIECSNDSGCISKKSTSDSKNTEYFVNAESTSIKNGIIYCTNKKCEKITPPGIPSFYVGISENSEVNGLIECVEEGKSTSTSTQNPAPVQNDDEEEEVEEEEETLELKKRSTNSGKCHLKTAFTSSGYYLNSGYNKAQNQTILCDSTEGCSTVKVDLGYYVNAGDASKPIIKCEKEGMECTADVSPVCPDSKVATPGNYCYEDSQLKFFPATNATAISASRSEDVYSFATIPDNGFPGIRRETGSLFKISRYFINRFYQSGIVMIDKNGKLVDSLSSDQSDVSLYDCNDSTKVCTEKPGCVSNTYMFDTENEKVVFCNNGKLEYADIQGYVVDSNRAVGTNHPYIIHCENGRCKSKRPKTTSYYENNGFDSSTNALIQCGSNNCATVAAEVGYYVGHDGAGVIQCTSTTSCNFSSVKSRVKYVNSGSNKASNAIIDCDKKSCSAVKAKIGYYMTYSNTLLIQCTSPSSCVEFTPTVNYYDNADSTEGSNTIINCVQTSQLITCAPEQTNNGFYMSSVPNVLIRCKSGSKCKTVTVKNGIFRGALKGLTGSSKRSGDDTIEEQAVREVDDVELELEEGEGLSVAMPRDSDEAYGIIRCVAGKCSALSPSEVASIPVCEFNNNKCYITLEYAMTKSATTSISAGNICTNADRSVFYFATDTIVVKPNVISGVTATYVYTTTNSNCLEVNDSYTDMYFTVGSNIFTLDQGSVLQFYETGYYFINTAKNALVSDNDIDAYNDENVKLYKCNGSSCSITDKPESLTYYADVNKRILKYNINSDAYSFAYPKDIICIFANNKCTPNADLKNQEFCITYKGELVLAKQDIKNRETGECYKATSITNSIYGYSQYLYNMNVFSAQMVDETGYYIVNLSTNTTVVSKNYKTKNNNLVVYGCQLSSCKEYVPDEDVYYYDARAKTILRYYDGVWTTPSNSGYAYISLNPASSYIYRFTKKLDEVTINAIASYGYYYTVDGEMYHCNQEEDGGCSPISNTGYYFTNAGEVYYCVHDSEELEPTECTKQACVSGQYYYIDEAYYRCESSSTLVPVMSRYCSYNENVVINFPLALTEEYPDKIKQAVDGIEKNNNSTAIVNRRGKNYLESISGIFTNCTYNVEETKSTFDLVCVNNYVAVDKETDEVKICSMEQLGYVECVEDEENPEKCNVSGAWPTFLRPSLFTLFIITLLTAIF